MSALFVKGATTMGLKGATTMGPKIARAGSVGARAGTRAAPRTFSVAGRSGPFSKVKGFKPKPNTKPNPGKKGTIDPKKNPQGQTADGVSTAAGAIPGGTGQSSGYPNMASSMAMTDGPGTLSTGLSAFATSATKGTSPSALENAMVRGTQKGKNAADAVASGLAAATSGSTQATVSGKTSGVVPKHKKNRCPCPINVRKYRQIFNDLPKGLQKMIAQYYKVASRCNCKSDNEELAKYLLEKILESKNILMRSGLPFIRTKMYEHLSKEAVAAGGTRKKSGHAMNKKSRTRKQQKTQFRRRTRKI